ECGATESSRFCPLKNEKWRQAKQNRLTKVTWEEGNILCNLCYMNLVENPLQRLKKSTKRVKVSVEEAEDLIRNEIEATVSEEITNQDVEAVMEGVEEVDTIDLIRAIETMTRTFYEREHIKKEGPIYLYNELRKVFQADKNLNNFLDQLYLVAKPIEHGDKTIDPYYLDSVGTSNEGLNILANISLTTTARAVDRKKKQLSESHGKYVEKALENSKFLDADQLQKEAHFIFQHRGDNTFRQYFVNTVKYPYTPKQLRTISKKYAIVLLDMFKKIYLARYRYTPIISCSDNINSYKLPSLGYEITDRHLPRGFVTIRKPFTTSLCDYMHCDSNYSADGKVLACGHGYHNHCLEKCRSKCLIYLDYLQNEVKKNIGALKISLTKVLNEKEFAGERTGNTVESDIDDADTATDNIAM
ncbi:23594_t:CDS:2, partial [Gigaspora margarita]